MRRRYDEDVIRKEQKAERDDYRQFMEDLPNYELEGRETLPGDKGQAAAGAAFGGTPVVTPTGQEYDPTARIESLRAKADAQTDEGRRKRMHEKIDELAMQGLTANAMQGQTAWRQGNLEAAADSLNKAYRFVTPGKRELVTVQDGKLMGPSGEVTEKEFVQAGMLLTDKEKAMEWMYKTRKEEEKQAFDEKMTTRRVEAEESRTRSMARNAASQEARVGLEERRVEIAEYLKQAEKTGKYADALAKLAQADAAFAKAYNSAKGLGWSEENILKMENDVADHFLDETGATYYSEQMAELAGTDPNLYNSMVADTKQLLFSNKPGALTREDAAILSQAWWGGQNGLELPDGVEFGRGSKTGKIVATINGRQVATPWSAGGQQAAGGEQAPPPEQPAPAAPPEEPTLAGLQDRYREDPSDRRFDPTRGY
jgi:hypothetical protein